VKSRYVSSRVTVGPLMDNSHNARGTAGGNMGFLSNCTATSLTISADVRAKAEDADQTGRDKGGVEDRVTCVWVNKSGQSIAA